MIKNKHKKVVFGKFLLDSISIGMYNHPLMLLREYIQNSTDSIDEFYKSHDNLERSKIGIVVNGTERSVVIKDNGGGISAKSAWNLLHDIGRSIKESSTHRGFRGIGRLGGLGYCEQLRFVTKAKGERIYSISTWNCNELRKIIKDEHKKLDLSRLLKNIIVFNQEEYPGNRNDHFFTVEMHDVKSSRDILIDVPAIKTYLSQVAPVPFNTETFSSAKIIDDELRNEIPQYRTYNIYVNDEQIFKPYKDAFNIGSKSTDRIKNINFLKLEYDRTPLAFAWIGEAQLLGVISNSNMVGGIRLRSGNFLVGDKNTLSELYREPRFNSYLIGEVHIVDLRLVLNSRRDDFEDNDVKDKFYDCFIREIGLPYSQKIKQISLERISLRHQQKFDNLIEKAKKISTDGFLAYPQQKDVVSYLKQIVSGKIDKNGLHDLMKEVARSKHFLDLNHKNISPHTKILAKSICDIIYKRCSNKTEAENIIHKVISAYGR